MTVMKHLVSWGRDSALAWDIAGALAFMALVLLSSGGLADTPGLLFDVGPSAQMIWSIVQITPLALRRRHPQTAALAYVALVLVQLIVGPVMTFADLLSVLVLYSVIVYGDPRNAKAFIVMAFAVGTLSGGVIGWATEVGPYAVDHTAADGQVDVCQNTYVGGFHLDGACASSVLRVAIAVTVMIWICLISTIIIAYWQRARWATVRLMQERNEALRASEAEERHIAALAERARIARDMHDVVAHTLSIIIIQSDGGRYAGAHDPAVARSTMETIRHESERALHDMKRLLGVFGGSPHADYEDIAALVDQARAVSPDCTIERRIEGAPAPARLDDRASVAVYHVVQEALTNVRKYAGPNVRVTIAETWGPGGMGVVVSDNGRGASATMDGHKPGYGLLGMRERIGAVGGTVSAGPRVGGGFTVAVNVPYASIPSTAASPVGDGMPAAAGTTAPAAAPVIAADARQIPLPAARTAATVAAQAEFTAGLSPASSPEPHDIRDHAVGGTDRPAKPRRFDRLTAARGASARGASGRGEVALPQLPSLSRLREALRSKPIMQATGIDERLNHVERLSQWTERHYLLMDAIGTLLLLSMLRGTQSSIGQFVDPPVSGTTWVLGYLFTLLTVAPLMFRRKFPELSAAWVAVFSALQLLCYPQVMFANLFALCSLYSAVLYGRDRAWRWASFAAGANVLLIGASIAAKSMGYSTLIRMIVSQRDFDSNFAAGNAAIIGVTYAGTVGVMCLGAIALARWRRSSGSNVLVLQARAEALQAEQAKQRILAANMERDRISANIQSEVTQTLTSVIDQAAAGLRMLDEAEARGEEPPPESINDSFAAIGRQGRTALAHMRELLTVLRETGFSDERHEHEQPEMALKPAVSLDEQMRRSA